MKENTSSASALTSVRGNKTETSSELAQAWLAYTNAPDCKRKAQEFEVELNKTLKCWVPDGTQTGVLTGLESEIRQRAAILLIDRFLAGNAGLTSSTPSGSVPESRKYLAQAINRAVKYSRQAILRYESGVASKHEFREDINSLAFVTHPTQHRNVWELPLDLQLQLVLGGLRMAIREKEIPLKTVEMIRFMIKNGTSASDIARQLKISPQAVHQRLRKSGEYLWNHIEKTEFPL